MQNYLRFFVKCLSKKKSNYATEYNDDVPETYMNTLTFRHTDYSSFFFTSLSVYVICALNTGTEM